MYINEFIDAGFNFEIEGENLAVQPASRLTPKQLQFIRQHKAEILDELRHGTDRINDVDEGAANPKPSCQLNDINPIHLKEAVHLYKRRGWIRIFSAYLNQSIYLVRNKWVKVPDPTLSKYTQNEIEALKGLSWEEAQTLHKAKVLFNGEIL
jgi:hypothetical protein